MIYAPISTPDQLLAVLPHLLDTREEAEELWKSINEEHNPACDLYLNDFSKEHAKAYTSYREAFEDLYPGDIDEFKREKCEDYEACITNFCHYYADWLNFNYAVYYIGENKFIITY